MDYNFFLFTKLHEIIFNPKTEYDILYEELIRLYEEWNQWDIVSCPSDLGTYESILQFLENKTTDDVVKQIKEDISMQDLTAIYELLKFIPKKNLLEYLNK